jgi:hypothetical protein
MQVAGKSRAWHKEHELCALLLLIETYILNFNESVNMSFDIIAWYVRIQSRSINLNTCRRKDAVNVIRFFLNKHIITYIIRCLKYHLYYKSIMSA